MDPKHHVEILSRKDLINDFFRLEEVELRHSLHNGEMSPVQRRLSLERVNSAAAVVYHQDLDEFILVEQFRYPTFAQTGGWLKELVAGSIENAEKAEDCIRREIAEETGLRVQSLKVLSTFYTSPGTTSERVFLFHATVTGELRRHVQGSPDKSEDIRVFSYSREEMASKLKSGEIRDAKTIIGLQNTLQTLQSKAE